MGKKILVGDDRLDFARREFGKYFPDDEVIYAGTPEVLLELARQHPDADMIFTDLQYTYLGKEGLDVLRALEGDAREVYLWTASEDFSVAAEAIKLGAERVIAKDRLGEFAGYAEGPEAAPAPNKDGGVLVVVPHGETAAAAMRKSVEANWPHGGVTIISSRELKAVPGSFGKIVYVTGIGREEGSAKGFIDHEDKYRETPLGYREIVEIPVTEAVVGVIGELAKGMKGPESG